MLMNLEEEDEEYNVYDLNDSQNELEENKKVITETKKRVSIDLSDDPAI